MTKTSPPPAHHRDVISAPTLSQPLPNLKIFEIIKIQSQKYRYKHRKNCECCPLSQLIVRLQRLSWIQVLNCQYYNQFRKVDLGRSFLVRSCLLVTLIKCPKGHKCVGSLCRLVKTLIVSSVRQTDQGTRSPIELFWRAKNNHKIMNKFQRSENTVFSLWW